MNKSQLKSAEYVYHSVMKVSLWWFIFSIKFDNSKPDFLKSVNVTCTHTFAVLLIVFNLE